MELKGKVVKVNPTESFGANGFKKAELWIEVLDGEYSQTLSIEAVKEKADEIQSIKIGSEIKVFFNLRGRVWTNKEGVEKVFNSIQLWKYEQIKIEF